jgi:hypothetical protein
LNKYKDLIIFKIYQLWIDSKKNFLSAEVFRSSNLLQGTGNYKSNTSR